ncbi:MAG: TRAP transporter small permease [Ectothiorhodospiraceae bacterium]|nr:TRAP transporter small permease [Chromatiales bacterium]MCP5154132.1 TRAP transporter small permease [Ectothiorhodospiraceae bacterium]
MLTFNRWVERLTALLRVCVLLLATAIFAIVVFTVITRYAFNWVLSWSEEVPRYLLIWVTFLSAAIGVDLKDHIAFDFIHTRLPRLLAAGVDILINAGLIAFGGLMLVYGIQFVQDFGGDWMESIPFTNVWYYPAIPVCGALIILYAVRDQLNIWFAPELRTQRTVLEEFE